MLGCRTIDLLVLLLLQSNMNLVKSGTCRRQLVRLQGFAAHDYRLDFSLRQVQGPLQEAGDRLHSLAKHSEFNLRCGCWAPAALRLCVAKVLVMPVTLYSSLPLCRVL